MIVNPVVGVAGGVAGGASTGSMPPLFIYGSLMEHRVLRALIGRVPCLTSATLADFHRHRVKDCVYPAIAPKAGGKVAGKLVEGLSDVEMKIFDLFEDEDYVKEDAKVMVSDALTQRPISPSGPPMAETATEEGAKEGETIEGMSSSGNGKAEEKEAIVYVWSPEARLRGDLYDTWDYAEHFLPHADDYVTMCSEFLQSIVSDGLVPHWKEEAKEEEEA